MRLFNNHLRKEEATLEFPFVLLAAVQPVKLSYQIVVVYLMKYKSQFNETVLIEHSNGTRLVFQLKRVNNRPRWVVIGVNLPSCAERALLQNCCTDYILS